MEKLDHSEIKKNVPTKEAVQNLIKSEEELGVDQTTCTDQHAINKLEGDEMTGDCDD